MNENINLYEILKDCPKGTKFYSPLFGDVSFVEIKEIYWIEVSLSDGTTATFTCDGKYYDIYNGECLLFPSKEQRDWNKFKCSKQKFNPNTLKPFDKVLVRNGRLVCWNCDLFSNKNNFGDFEFICIGNSHKYCIPYNDDTKHLIGTKDEAPEYYRYWED